MSSQLTIPPHKSRGRPRTFDREAALQSALGVFWRRGYEPASILELCAAMGINPPSLYAAFGNKAQLFMKAVDHYETVFWDNAWERMAIGQNVQEDMERFFPGGRKHPDVTGRTLRLPCHSRRHQRFRRRPVCEQRPQDASRRGIRTVLYADQTEHRREVTTLQHRHRERRSRAEHHAARHVAAGAGRRIAGSTGTYRRFGHGHAIWRTTPAKVLTHRRYVARD